MNRQYWSKDADRKWRASFTRENVEGARLLAHRLRHQSVESVVRAEKAAHVAREAKEDMEARRIAREAVKDGIDKIQVSTDSDIVSIYKAKAGTKTLTIYLRGKKIEQKFDEIGNLVEEVEVPLQ